MFFIYSFSSQNLFPGKWIYILQAKCLRIIKRYDCRTSKLQFQMRFLCRQELFSQFSAVLTHKRCWRVIFIVLTRKPLLHLAVNKAGIARGRNRDNSYFVPAKAPNSLFSRFLTGFAVFSCEYFLAGTYVAVCFVKGNTLAVVLTRQVDTWRLQKEKEKKKKNILLHSLFAQIIADIFVTKISLWINDNIYPDSN